VGGLGAEDHQAHRVLVGDLAAGRRCDVHASELTPIGPSGGVLAQPTQDLHAHLVSLRLGVAGGAVPGDAGNRGRGVIPGARPVHVEVGGPVRQAAQRVGERADRLPGIDRPQPDPGVFQAPVGAAQCRCGAEEHRAGHPARREVSPERRRLVELGG
jgi:hypothetical protein